MGNYSWSFCLVPCLLRTKLRKVPGHQQFWCRQCKIYTERISRIVTPLGVMNLVHNGPSNGWLSDAAKPLPDPMLTSHQYAPLCLISMQVMTYIDDDENFECILFKMSPGLNELTNLSGKALYILLTLTPDTFMEFPLTGSQLINPGLEFFCSKINCPLSRHSLCSALANVPHRLFPCLYAPFVRLYIVDQTQGSSASKRTAP